jgi:hypothetical protein
VRDDAGTARRLWLFLRGQSAPGAVGCHRNVQSAAHQGAAGCARALICPVGAGIYVRYIRLESEKI